MAKTIPIALQAHYTAGRMRNAVALRLDRADGQAFGFTSADEPVTFAGLDYEPGSVTATAIASAADMSVDNLELQVLEDDSLFTLPEVRGGRWEGARWRLFSYNWAAPADGVEPLGAGTVGNITLELGRAVVELRGLQQYLQQALGVVTTKTCRARLGDELCRVALGPYTFSGEVQAVTSAQQFATDLAEADDFFGNGLLRWLTGQNTGLSRRVKAHAASGDITLVLPMVYEVEAGDTFEIVAGCRGRREDCRDKFDNILNMQAEPDLAGQDAITAPAEPGE
jgi:uncharacterized phage protein (TIGR02218 family)